MQDNYVISGAAHREPPTGFFERLRYLGPGFILSASIVGSGELIATTILGARAGFVMFWIILVSCLVKVAVQLQFGKQAIYTGETVMTSFNKLGRRKIGGAHWTVWSVGFLTLLKIIQIGGMLGGSALVLVMLFPGTHVALWTITCAIIVGALIYLNYYKLIEKASLVMIGFFTLLTLASVIAVRYTPYAFTWVDVASGLTFRLPREMVLIAIGAFGITGVASDEIIAYNYWCLEKGYAAHAGRNDGTEAWRKRARGWVRVMELDATVAMIIYTVVTAAFYLLGASVLHTRGETPEGNALLEVLGGIYTETLGNWARLVFLVGAFFVLFSSVFATLGYWSRLFSDISGQAGWIRFYDTAQRGRTVRLLAILFPLLWTIAFLFIQLPVLMIISGGVVGAVLLLITLFAAVAFRKRELEIYPPNRLFDLFFALSALSILLVAVYGLAQFLLSL